MDIRRPAQGTVGHMIAFLGEQADDPAFNTVTMLAMKSGVVSVTRTLGIDRSTAVESLDVEELMDRFQLAKGPTFRSAATYRTRLRVATQLYTAWLNSDPEWKHIARTRPSAQGAISMTTTDATRIIDFKISQDFSVRLELPYTLNKSTALRLHSLIDSLVLDES